MRLGVFIRGGKETRSDFPWVHKKMVAFCRRRKIVTFCLECTVKRPSEDTVRQWPSARQERSSPDTKAANTLFCLLTSKRSENKRPVCSTLLWWPEWVSTWARQLTSICFFVYFASLLQKKKKKKESFLPHRILGRIKCKMNLKHMICGKCDGFLQYITLNFCLSTLGRCQVELLQFDAVHNNTGSSQCFS